MKITFTLLFLLLVCANGNGANIKDIGLPFIVNHQRDVYQASTQNWSVAQSDRGYMYFGNNDGILQYDGSGWTIHTVPNASVVRSVYASGDTIFAGAFEELGYLAPDTTGALVWNSLVEFIPETFRGFDEIWRIFRDEKGRMIFQSFSYIFILEDNRMKIIEPLKRFSFMHQINDRFYVVDTGKGLMNLHNDTLSLVSENPVFFRNEISFMLPHENDDIVVGTSNEGLFILSDYRLQPWQTPVNNFLQQFNIFSGVRLSGGNFAFGSIGNGLFITNPEGEILQHLNRMKGLQNNTILALFEDRHQNLWLGLDNGIDYVEISSPISMLNHIYNLESTYASVVYNDILYVGTNQGLFAAPLEAISHFDEDISRFELVKGTEGQVWSLEIIANTLFCGNNYGAFVIEGYDAKQISDVRGYWSFFPSPLSADILIAGTYTGMVRLGKRNGEWVFLDEVKGFRESSRNIFVDKKNQFWISHGYRGLFKLVLNEDFSEVRSVRLFRDEAGLPRELPYNIQRVKDKMMVTTREGILQYDFSKNRFVPDEFYNDLFASHGFIDKIFEDTAGNLWYYTDEQLGIMRLLEDGSFRDIKAPFSRVNPFLMPAFQNIYVHDNYNVFVGSESGLVHYNPSIINDYRVADDVYLKEITFYGNDASQTLQSFNPLIINNEKSSPEVPFSQNSVTFRFTTPVYENPAAVRFSYHLKGFDLQWSDWDVLNFKEYTNLREGDYTFEVKALNAFGVESNIATFSFSVKPPFYRSSIAYFVYTIILFLIIAGNIHFIRKRMLKIRLKEKIRHENRLAQREKLFEEQTALSENEIVQLRNESLQSEMKHKNQELANATLHLIQKNKTLTYLKNDLTKLQKSLSSDNPEKHSVTNLLKKVNRDLRNEKNWELFNSYFDDVHQDFITRLKNEYPDLSPKELRLCAYLRMNLSSKEIAPLMNISVRGVEISRYRLRKKLGLGHNVNLTDYLLSY